MANGTATCESGKKRNGIAGVILSKNTPVVTSIGSFVAVVVFLLVSQARIIDYQQRLTTLEQDHWGWARQQAWIFLLKDGLSDKREAIPDACDVQRYERQTEEKL